MLKNLFKDSVAYSLANFIQKLVPLALIPVITSYFGQNGLKVYDVSFVYAYLFSWIVILGQDAAASVYYFDERKENFNKREVLSNAFFLQCGSFLVFLLLFIIFRNVFSATLFPNDSQLADFWMKALYIIPGHIALNFSLNILLWNSIKNSYIFLCLLQVILSVAGVFFTIYFLNAGMTELFYALIIANSICGVIALFVVRKHLFKNPFPLNKKLLSKLLLFGLPFCLTAFFQQLLPAIDRLFLLKYNYNDSLAQYILAVKIGSFLNLGFSAFVLAFTPYSLKKLNEESAELELSALFRFISTGAFILIPIALLFKDIFIKLFADASYGLAATLLPFFFFAWVFDLFSYFSMLGLYRKQNSLIVLLMFFASTILVSILNMLLIPNIGLYGAALSFCITKIALFVVPLFYFRRHFKLSIHAGSFLLAFSVAALCSYLLYRVEFGLYIFILAAVIVVTVFYLYRFLQNSQYLVSLKIESK